MKLQIYSATGGKQIFCLVMYLLLIVDIQCTLSNTDQKTKKNIKVKKGPISKSVMDRNLVIENVNVDNILTEHQSYYKNIRKQFEGKALGYVTPWNNHGYNIAKIFRNKFNLVSPVWLQIRRQGVKNYVVSGTHDVDQSWLEEVRGNDGEKVGIIPRMLFDGWTNQNFASLLSGAEERSALSQTLVDLAREWKFDGFVLEVWSQLAGHVKSHVLVDLVSSVCRRLRSAGLVAVLVVPPSRGSAPEMFGKEEFDGLIEDVDAFSLMTYDFANPQRPGPNSPISWVRRCVETLVPVAGDPHRAKILLGLNFYGYDYTPAGGGAIVNHQYLSLLKDLKGPLQYDSDSAEHYFEVRNSQGRHTVFYPTLHSVNERIRLAENLGTGLAVWELGQGLDYFYDLL